jgi:uncharacterized peroxidase-related enzyme
LDEIDTRTATTLAGVKTKLGRLPNLITTFAQAPAALDGYLQLAGSVAGGRLSARQREQIAIAVAEANACAYCLNAHAAIGKSVGLGPADIEAARRGQASDPMEQATTELALAIVGTRGEVSDAELEAARQAGVDDGLIVEIVANVALNVMTNYLNRVADTEVDFPIYETSAAA